MTQHAIIFDTLRYAKKLQKAGFTEIQAETQIEIIKEQSDAINGLIDDSLATKQDIKELELKIETSKNELTLRIDAIKNELLLKLGRMIVGGVVGGLGTLVVLMKVFKL
jgi:hypothetical protein